MELYLLILLLSLTSLFPSPSSSSANGKYEACSKDLQCGNLGNNVGFPFYDGSTRPNYCGYFKLTCQGLQQITISDNSYYVSNINVSDYTINVRREDTWAGSSCPDTLTNTTIDFSKYNFTSDYQNITFFYDCSSINDLSGLSLSTSCSNLGGNGITSGYYLTQKMVDDNKELNLLQNCNSNLYIPVLQSVAETIDSTPNLVTLIAAFRDGFELGLIADSVDECSKCTKSNGECGYDWDSNKFTCHCADKDYGIECGVDSSTTHNKKGQHKKMVSILGFLAAAAVGIVILGFLIFFSKHFLQKCKPIPQDRSVEDCLKSYKSTFPRRYTYANVKKMTNSFKQKLGEGGYGSVFKGSLHDGRSVAVKVWKQSKGDGQDFVNEVTSISRTSHVNIVSLLGFCFEGPKRALIYEFMPNGSLERFIRVRDSNDNNQSLSATKLLEIVVGIARGLEYLHRGCNTRIVHLDIKPHNILLDSEFIPKISDFGLAKSYKQKESIISMSGARGTIGYIAPEVILRSFGGVSHKSDVYSFGMMTLEMVGCTKRLNQNVENSSEMYFPRWIYKQLEQETILDSGGILNEEEREMERKMILVGLWCIQTNPMARPSMSRVVEMLEGEVGLLQVPPMPSLASPPRQQQMDDDSRSFLSSTTTSTCP